MLELFSPFHTLGLYLEGSLLKGARVCRSNGKLQLLHLEAVEAKSLEVQPEFLREIRNSLHVTAVPTAELLVRSLEIKLIKRKDVDAVLSFQAEPLLPYPPDQAILDRIYLSQSDNQTVLTLLALRKDHLKSDLSIWERLNPNIDPEIVGSVPTALVTFSNYFYSSKESHVILHVDLTSTSILLANEGKLLLSYGLPLGLQHVENAYILDKQVSANEARQNLEKMNFLDLDSKEYPNLYRLTQQFRQSVLKTFYAIIKQSKTLEISEILITGPGAAYPDLLQTLCQKLGRTLAAPGLSVEDKKRIQYPQDYSIFDLQSYAVAIGLALAPFESEPPINFRQQEFAYPDPWKRLKKPMILFSILSLLVAFLCYIFGEVWLGYQEDGLKEKYVELLASMDKSYDSFELEYEIKNPQSKDRAGIGDEEIIPPEALNQEDLLKRIDYLAKQIEAIPEIFPLQPNIPRVSDLLAWLSEHPQVVSPLKEKEEGALSSLQIENFIYALTKHPEQGKKDEKYQVKVDLEFSSPTPKQAREFHDALIAPNDLVDPKAEVKWSSNRGKYRTSFFLKDKTSYSTPSASQFGGK